MPAGTVDRGAHGRARLPLRQARRLLPGRLPVRARAARQRRAARTPAARAEPSRGRADRGRDQRRRPRDRCLDRSPRRADERLRLPVPARAFASRSRSCSKSSPTLPACPATSTRPRLVRLSSESVMLAWTGAVAGHWAIRAAAIDQRGVLPPSTISPAGRDALLAGLAAGTERRGARAVERTAADGRGPGSRRAGDLRRAWVRRLPRTGQVRRPRTARCAGAEQRRDRRLRSRQRPCGAVWRTGAGALAYAVRAPGAPSAASDATRDARRATSTSDRSEIGGISDCPACSLPSTDSHRDGRQCSWSMNV